jgi:hypothetical protein
MDGLHGWGIRTSIFARAINQGGSTQVGAYLELGHFKHGLAIREARVQAGNGRGAGGRTRAEEGLIHLARNELPAQRAVPGDELPHGLARGREAAGIPGSEQAHIRIPLVGGGGGGEDGRGGRISFHHLSQGIVEVGLVEVEEVQLPLHLCL